MGEVIFQYLKMLRHLSKPEQRRIFDEIQKIENINWSTKEDHKSITNCVDAVENMREYPTKENFKIILTPFFRRVQTSVQNLTP